MDTSSRPPLTLGQIRAAFPGHEITEDRRRDPVRYHATARVPGARPACVVTDDLDELAACLAAAGDDLAALRAAHPAWSISAGWVAAGSGPDRRVLIASRDGDTFTALDAAGLAVRITAAGHAR